jgi:hypothetical protein
VDTADNGFMTGVAIGPCTSRNGRIYTQENLAKAVGRMQKRLAEGTPIAMAVSHGDAWDDRSDRVFAKVTEVSQDAFGVINYEAKFAPTQLGQEMRALYKEGFIGAQSIRGEWVGPVKVVQDTAGKVIGETADDMDIVGIDATLMPGVAIAGVRTVESAPTKPQRATGLFVESIELPVIADAGKPTAEATLPSNDAHTSQKENVMSETAANGAATEAPKSGVLETAAEPSFAMSPESFAKAITESNVAAWNAGFAAARAAAPAPVAAPVTEATAVTQPATGAAEGASKPLAEMNAEELDKLIDLRAIKLLQENKVLPDRKGLVDTDQSTPVSEATSQAPVGAQKSNHAGLKEALSARATEINEQYPAASRPTRRRELSSGRP